MNRSAFIPPVAAAEAAFAKAGLAPSAGPVVAGVSGGLDSMVLLHVLRAAGFLVVAVHVNYGMRGEESDADERLVAETSQRWGASCRIFRADGALADHGNFQDKARQFRYACYMQVFAEVGGQAVATGHHRQDRIETILMRMLRGASPTSWDGLREWSPPLLRPLLSVDRASIEAYARREGVPWREDRSNFGAGYARNLLRNRLVPEFDELFPGWSANVERLSAYGEAFADALDALSGEMGPGLPLSVLRGRSEALQGALLHRFLQRHGVEVSSKHVPSLLRLLESQKGRSVPVGAGVRLVREADMLALETGSAEEGAPVGEHEHAGPFGDGWGPFHHPFGTIAWEPSAEAASPADRGALRLVSPDNTLVIRRWKAGDRVAGLPGGKSRKVSDLLTDWKVPTRARASAWVIALDGKPAACIFAHPGDPVRFAVSEAARRAAGGGLRIDFTNP